MSNENAADTLVYDMGFNRTEVNMALQDTSGDVDKALEKLLSGQYKPPPYVAGQHAENELEEEEKKTKLYPNMSNVFSGLMHRNKAPDYKSKDATAPSLFSGNAVDLAEEALPNLTSLPPPYQKIEREGKIKDWEVDMNVVYLNNQYNQQDSCRPPAGVSDFNPLPTRDERCAVCFNAVVTNDSSEQIVSQKEKIFHHGCFMKKHGPKCAYCCFPLTQADKDHELSGKYLVYKSKDYHVECYEKYAGPRCNYCFNVIIEKPNGEFSGNWVVDKKEQYHVECLHRKMYAIWRAKHS